MPFERACQRGNEFGPGQESHRCALRDGILSNARERTVNLEWLGAISMSVVPVVTISACGLLSLAFMGGWQR
jgi:hypothetical protein